MRRRLVPALVGSLLIAACSSGESVITSGNEDPTVVATTTVADDASVDEPAEPSEDPSDDGTSDDGASDDGASDDDASDDDGGEPAATTTVPTLDLPPCPIEALDAADGVVEITFWHGLNVENEESLQTVVDQYNARQDRVRVTLQNQGGYLETIDEYYQSGGDSRPELVMFPEYAMQQAIDSGTVIPVQSCIDGSGFDTAPIQPSILQAYSAQGAQWGMPFNVSNPVLYYNRKMFEAAGLDPDAPPRSLEEVRSYSQQLIDSGAASYGIAIDSGLDSGGGWYLEQWMANVGQPIANNDNGRSAPATEVLFDGEVGVELLTYVQGLVNDGLAFYVGDNAGGADQLLKLADAQEPAAMAISTSAALGSVVSALGSGLIPGLTTEDVGVGALPGPSGTPSAIIGGAALYVVAGQGDAAAAAAWDFVEYVISAELQAQWTVLTGYLPIRDDALELEPAASTFAADPRYRVAYDQLQTSLDVAANGPLLGPHRQIRSEMANAVAAILTGADVASTLAAAATISDAYLADYIANN